MKPEKNDGRRFPRVHFRRDYGANDRITKAHLQWPNFEFSDVLDLSLGGLATSKPSLLEFEVGSEVNLTLELSDLPSLSLSAQIVWIKEFAVGVSFISLDPKGHLVLRQFLSDKLVGTHLRLMAKEFYAKDANYDLWFAGPKETHIFLKLDPETLTTIISAEVLSDGQRLIFDRQKITTGQELRAPLIQILNHAPEKHVELSQFLEQLLKSNSSRGDMA